MKTLSLCIFFTLVLICLPRPGLRAVSAGTLRQGLADKSGIKAVYAVDRTHTFVIGQLPPADESKAFRVLGRYDEGSGSTLPAVMIEHAEEPMIYKKPDPLSLEALRSGSMKLSRKPFSPGSEGYSSLDVFEAATLSCQGGGGNPLYVIPKKYGRFKRLTEVGAMEAFQYILQKGAANVWLMACDGKDSVRFQVLKNYDFINDGEDVAEFRQGLVLDDVNYVRDERVEAARLADLERTRYGSAASLEYTARDMAEESLAPGKAVHYSRGGLKVANSE